MATKDITETTECSICHDYYNDPKILPCAHILCRNCLITWMKKKSHPLCPLCRSSIVDPQDFSSDKIEDFVDCLSTDHAMSAMVESVKIITQDHVCHVHSDVIAASFCLQCSVKMCQMCAEVHGKLQITSVHKLESLSTLTLQCLTTSRQEPCSVHRDKTSELFCSRHNVLICQMCAISKHRICQKVTDLQELCDKYKRALSELEVRVNMKITALGQALANIEEHLLKSEKSITVIFAEIDKTCDSFVNSVETCRKRLKKLVQDADDKIKITALEQKSSLGEKRGGLTSHLNLIQRIQQTAHGSSLVAMVPKLESRIATLDPQRPLTEVRQYLKRVTLTINPEAIRRVERELEKIGSIVISSPEVQENMTPICGPAQITKQRLRTSDAERKLHKAWDKEVPAFQAKVTIEPTVDAIRNNLSGDYILSVAQTSLKLLDPSGTNCVCQWPYKYIRKYGHIGCVFRLEVGRKNSTGEGDFAFLTINSEMLVSVVREACRNLLSPANN